MKQKFSHLQPAGLFIRLGSLAIDAFAVTLLECLAAVIVVFFIWIGEFSGLISFSSYQGLTDVLTHHPVLSPFLTAYLATIWIVFFVYCWAGTGQTPGMKVWKLTLRNADNSSITITQALIRLFTSCFGLSNLLIPFDPEKRGFHDIWAQTQMYKKAS